MHILCNKTDDDDDDDDDEEVTAQGNLLQAKMCGIFKHFCNL